MSTTKTNSIAMDSPASHRWAVSLACEIAIDAGARDGRKRALVAPVPFDEALTIAVDLLPDAIATEGFVSDAGGRPPYNLADDEHNRIAVSYKKAFVAAFVNHSN